MACEIDDCECRHCRKCGEHCFDDEGSVCDDCLLEDAHERTERQKKAFGGNYEEAAKHFDW